VKEVKFDPDEKIVHLGQETSTAYIIQSGGAILKRNGIDRIFIAGDLIDPVSIVSRKCTGDVYAVGATSLIAGSIEEILEFIKKNPKLLQRALLKAVEELPYFGEELSDKLQSMEEVTAILISKRQALLNKYPPLLFGEKPLYRKAVKCLQKKDFTNAAHNFRCYLNQYQNSLLSRPVKLFLALAELNLSNYNSAAELLTSLLDNSKDVVSDYVRKLFSVFELNETAYILTKGVPIYPKTFYNKIINANENKITFFEEDAPLVEEGVPLNRIYYVIEGELWVIKQHGSKFFKLTAIPQGATFGELHILTGSKADSALIGKAGAKLIAIDRKEFFKISIFELPDVGVELLKYLLLYEKELLGKD